jgi:hypothetical protein
MFACILMLGFGLEVETYNALGDAQVSWYATLVRTGAYWLIKENQYIGLHEHTRMPIARQQLDKHLPRRPILGKEPVARLSLQ